MEVLVINTEQFRLKIHFEKHIPFFGEKYQVIGCL